MLAAQLDGANCWYLKVRMHYADKLGDALLQGLHVAGK